MDGVHQLLDGTLRSCLDNYVLPSLVPLPHHSWGYSPMRVASSGSAYSLAVSECLVLTSLRNAGALLGYITWKRPKLALTMATAAAAVTAPYLGFAMAALNRWQVSSHLP
jgi:hypothetical protein